MDDPSRRRRFLATTAAGVAAVLGGCGRLATSPPSVITDRGTPTPRRTSTETAVTDPEDLPDSVELETVATGFSVPLDVAFAPAADRRYIADKYGRVYVHESDGLRDEPLLDLCDAIEIGLEQGLLGIALHPAFAENRRLYVRYSAPRRPGTPESYSHTFVLSEFTVTPDGREVDRDSERTVLEIPEPQPNHNAGGIQFGPDGYLYVAVGDGGGGGDRWRGHVEDWYDAVGGGNAQDVTENLLGSILRIDVDGRERGKRYAVPDDNPLVGTTGLDEHYAWGFRNPWRMSFDGEDFFVGDVGQNAYEEVSLVEKGGNYGWNVKEGTHCYDVNDCPDSTPEDVRGGEPLIDPIVEYPHSGRPIQGNSVTGGYVYRGTALPNMRGAYVFSDLDAKGQLFVATRPEDGGMWPIKAVEVAGEDGERLRFVFSFGRDSSGEVYVLGAARLGTDVTTGGLYRIVSADR